jgi:hypothetical protein
MVRRGDGVRQAAVTAHRLVAGMGPRLPRRHLRAAVMEPLPEAVMEVRRPVVVLVVANSASSLQAPR